MAGFLRDESRRETTMSRTTVSRGERVEAVLDSDS